MAIHLPFHRTIRGIKPSFNSGYSGWAFVLDSDYANSPAQYTRAFGIIESGMRTIFEFTEPAEECIEAYSYRIHELLMRICIEIEANFRAILNENIFNPPVNRFGNREYNINTFMKIDRSHHLSSYELMFTNWVGTRRTWKPFESWKNGGKLDWYQSYNASKHDRSSNFKQANLGALMSAFAALVIVISSQFKNQSFSGAASHLELSGYEYYEMEDTISTLCRINYPKDWNDQEIYDFDWSLLKKEGIRFQKFDYDAI